MGDAIYTDQYVAGGTVSNVLIDGNTFAGNNDAGLDFSSSDATKPATNITISNNVFNGNARGMVAFSLTSSLVTGNTFENSTASDTADVRLFEGVNDLTITGNLLENGAGRALRINNEGSFPSLANAANVTFTGNAIEGYTGPADTVNVDPSGYTGTLNASGNWWGTTDASAILNLTFGPVGFSPYLNSGTNSSTGPGFQGDYSVLDVTDLGSQSTPTGRIQEAVNLVTSGGTVNVGPGTYQEHVSITQPVILLGANANVNPVTSAASRRAESIVDGTLTDAPFSINANGVTINGFTITNGQNGLNAGVAIAETSSGYDVADNIIANNTIGIYANSNGAATIENNLFDANNLSGPSGGAGIYSDQGTVDLTVQGNEFENHTVNNPVIFAASSGTTENTGLQFLNNALHDNSSGVFGLNLVNSLFQNNAISTTSPGDVALTIGDGSSNVQVLDNVLEHNAVGLLIQDFGYFGTDPISNVVAHDNSFANNSQFGLKVVAGSYTGTVDATYNYWGVFSRSAVAAKIFQPDNNVDFTPFLTSTPVLTPTLTGPATMTTDRTPTIAWTPNIEAAAYDLKVIDLTTGGNVVIRQTDLTSTSFTPPVNLRYGHYRVFVRGIGAQGRYGAWSAGLDFTITPALTPAVTGPTATTTDHTPTIAWTNTGAALYDLKVVDMTTGGNVVIQMMDLTSTSFTPPVNLPFGHYRVLVRAANAQGEFGAWSTPYFFSIVH